MAQMNDGSILSTLLTGLRNAHALETEAVQILTRQSERLEKYPQLQARITRHIDESKGQRTRLEEVLAAHDASPNALKEAATGVAGNLAAMAHIPASDEVLKNSFASYAFEHYKIAAYKSLISMADACGESAAIAAAQANLTEEEDMAQWLEDNLEAVTKRFLELSQRGQA